MGGGKDCIRAAYRGCQSVDASSTNAAPPPSVQLTNKGGEPGLPSNEQADRSRTYAFSEFLRQELPTGH